MYFSKIVLAAIASVSLTAAAPALGKDPPSVTLSIVYLIMRIGEREIGATCTRDVNACPWSKYVRSEEKREFVERAVDCTRDVNACPWSKYVRSEEEKRDLVEKSVDCTRDVNACPWSKYVRSEEKKGFAERAVACTRDENACPWSKYAV